MKKINLLCGIALVAVVPLVLSSHVEDVFFFPWRAAQQVFLGALAVWVGARWMRGAAAPSLTLAEIPWALLAVWALVSPAWSVNPPDSMRRAIELATSIAAVWVGIALARGERKLWTAAIAAIAATSAYGMMQVVGIDWMPWSVGFGGRAFGTLGNPDYYAGHLLLVLPLAAAWLVSRPRLSPGLLAVGALFLLGFMFSQVRGAWLAALVVVGPAVWYAWKIRPSETELRRIKLAAAALAGIAALTLVVSPEMRGRAASILQMGGYDGAGRRYLWRVAASIWKDGPIKGFGAGGYRYQFPRYQHLGETMRSSEFRSYSYSEHAHNELLQLGAELGAVGVALFIWGLAAWGLRWSRGFWDALASGAREEAWSRLGIGLGILGSFAYSWVNFPLQIVPTSLLWWMMIGVGLENGRRVERWRFDRFTGAGAGVVIALLGAAGAVITGADLVGDGYLKELHGRISIQDYRTAVLVGPRAEKMLGFDYRVFRWMTRLAIVMENPQLAEQGVQARLRMHPYMAEPLSDRMELERKMGRTKEAEKRGLELVQAAPNFANGWGILGEIYFEKGEYTKSAEAFAKAAYYQENNPSWHHNLAAALGNLKRYREAVAEDEKAIALDPRFVDAYLTMALSTKALGETVKAREIAEKAYQISPGDGRIHTLIRQLQK